VIAGVILIGVVAVVLAVVGVGGGSSARKASTAAGSATSAGGSHARASGARQSSKARSGSGSPAETSVVVLNGTETTGLAHRLAGRLHQSGYSRATALSGHPPGANQVSVVEYASGHKGAAEGVARSLGVSQTQPMEAAVASLAGSAPVVVIVGLDKSASGP
jgi:hypothetical protein